MIKTNLKGVASELGVSLSTVSKALRDSYDISAATKKKVKEMADKMGYRPNPYAGFLHTQKSKTIGIVVPEINNNFFIQAINGVQSIARENDYHVLIYVTDDSYQIEESILKNLQTGRVDGVIMSLAGTTKNPDHINELIGYNIPVIFFDRICHEIETAKIITDDFSSGLNATEHLIKNGCRQIAYLSISENLSIDHKRKQGYIEALHKYDLPVIDSLIVNCNGDERSNYRKIKQLLQGTVIPDGIFSSVEKMALTTYYVCRDLGISIPGQVKVICFSNLRTAPLLNPSLTTITQPAYDMGKEAAAILFKYLKKRQIQITNEHIVIKSELVKRDSTRNDV